MTQLDPPAFSESPGDDDSGDVRESNWRIDLDPGDTVIVAMRLIKFVGPQETTNGSTTHQTRKRKHQINQILSSSTSPTLTDVACTLMFELR